MIKKSAGIIIFLIFINTVKIYGNLQIISVNKINTSEISSNITASNNKIYYLSDSWTAPQGLDTCVRIDGSLT
jgi:hypothetical protein